MPSQTPVGMTPDPLFGWLPRLATASSIAAVHELLRQVCAAVRHTPTYRLVWNDTTTVSYTQTSHAADPVDPTPAELAQLAAGELLILHDATDAAWTVLPLLHGVLRGWLLLPGRHGNDGQLLPIAYQAAARLATFGSELRAAAQVHELQTFDADPTVPDSAALLDDLYQAVQRILGVQHMFLALYDAPSGLLRFAVNFIHGQRDPETDQWQSAQGLAGEVIRRNTTLVTDNYMRACEEAGVTPRFLKNAPRAHAWLGVPLRYGDHTLGVLTIYADDPAVTYAAEYVSTLEVLAQWLAMTLERTQLHERTLQQTRQLELLNELGRTISSTLDLEAVPSLIMGRIQQIMGVEEGSLLLLDDTRSELVFRYSLSPFGRQLLGQRLPLNVGLAGLVVRTGQSLIVNRASNHPAFYAEIDAVTGHETRDMLCVPLIGRHGVEGVIEIINRRDGAPFTVRDRALLEAVADQAVIALENAELYTRTDRALARRIQELDLRNKQLQEIVQAGNVIKAATDLRTVLPELAQAVRNSVGFNVVSVYLLARQPGTPAMLQWLTGVHGDTALAGPFPPLAPEILELMLNPAGLRGVATYAIDHASSGDNPLRTSRNTPLEMPAGRIGTWHPNDLLVTVLRGAKGELLGIVTLEEPLDGMLPTAEQIQTLEIMTNQLVVALENTRLYEQLRQNLQGVTALSALGMAINHQGFDPEVIWQLTVGGIVDSSGALGAGVVVFGPNAALPTVLMLGREHQPTSDLLDLAHKVVARERPIPLRLGDPDFPRVIAEAGGRALLLLPLAGTYTTLGALYIWYPAMLPTSEEQDLVALFANQAAVAVENKLLAAAVREGRDRLASILASTEEAIMLLDASGNLIESNAAAERIFTPDLPTLLHAPVLSTLRSWGDQNYAQSECWAELEQALEQVRTGEQSEARGQIACAGVRPRWYSWTALPVLSEHTASPYPLLLVMRDVTASIEIDNLRQDLTYMIIHDLRGPLGSIMTSLDMLSKQMMGAVNEGQDKVLRIALRSGARLLKMVNMLLDISKLEAGQMPLAQRVIALPALLRTVVQSYDAVLTERNVTVEVVLPAVLPHAWIDASTIDRVVQNLFDNALKYSPNGGTIRLEAQIAQPQQLLREHPAGEWLVVQVQDGGPGIPAHMRERIFEKFAQVQKTAVKGSGLGLTYCRLAVEAHDGRIWVDDRDGAGTTFMFTIPLDSTGRPAEDVEPVQDAFAS